MRSEHREITDFLENYGAEHVRIIQTSRHPRLLFNWPSEAGEVEEKEFVIFGSPSDHRSSKNFIAQIKRNLGPPRPLPEREKRSLEDMMPELPTSTSMMALSSGESNMHKSPEKNTAVATGKVAVYTAVPGPGLRFELIIPKLIIEALTKAYPDRDKFRVELVSESSSEWELKITDQLNRGSVIHGPSKYNEYTWGTKAHQLKERFGRTSAEYLFVDDTIFVRLLEQKKNLQKNLGIQEAPKPVEHITEKGYHWKNPRFDKTETPELVTSPKPVLVTGPKPVLVTGPKPVIRDEAPIATTKAVTVEEQSEVEAEMRGLLRVLRHIEQNTMFRLVKDKEGNWTFFARIS